jgi:hypothetical protein
MYFILKNIYKRFLIFNGACAAITSSIQTFDKNSHIHLSFNGLHIRNTNASLLPIILS